jgi:ABC-2 type transport system permease protein
VKFRPGSFAWLVAHDLKLSFMRTRSMFGAARPITIIGIVVAIFAAFHLLAWPAAIWFVNAQATAGDDAMYYPALAGAALFVLPWLMAQALTNSTRALYSRGDLDLLLASPISSRTVVAARALAIAIECLTSVGIFLFPVANMTALLGGWRWLAIYPALAASGLFATGLGLATVVGLFQLAGPRKTRFISQIVATFIASAFVLSAQLVNVLPDAMRASIVSAINRPEPGSILDRDGFLWLPVRAAMGDGPALTAWMLLAVMVFACSAIALGPRFMASAVRSAGVAATSVKQHVSLRAVKFRAGVGGALRRKEWLLLRRDPFLASQLLLQIIYTLPISVVIWRSHGPDSPIALAVAPCVVVIAAQISASLAWLAVSSEDAPDFLASAPVSSSQVEKRKLEAIFVPLALVLAVPCLGLAWVEPGAAFQTMLFAVGAAASTALLNIWRPHPGRRTDVMRRHQQSKIVGLMEHMLSLCWAVAIVMAVLGSMIATLPIGLVVLLLWFNRPREAVNAPALTA